MTKIEKIIQERKLKPRDCAYHTWRDLSNKKGAYTGKVRILAIKGEKNARVEYKCPECGFDGYMESEWIKPFSFKCEKCSHVVKILKLREEFKRDQKKAKKAEENEKKGN